MNAVPIVNVHAVIDISEHENHTGRRILRLSDNSVQTLWRSFNFRVMFYVLKQIKPKFIESQIHNRDAAGHVLNVHDFLLQPLELCAAVFKIALFLGVDQVIVTGGGHDRNLHTGFHAAFQVDILVEVHIRPEVYKLNVVVFASDTVNSSEPLDNADRVPMNIVIYKIITILQVLTFGNTIGRNQNIKLVRASGQEYRFPLGNR